jgi:hypothetical protein
MIGRSETGTGREATTVSALERSLIGNMDLESYGYKTWLFQERPKNRGLSVSLVQDIYPQSKMLGNCKIGKSARSIETALDLTPIRDGQVQTSRRWSRDRVRCCHPGYAVGAG